MITVEELVLKRDLGLSFIGGRNGGLNIVTWAHAVDLPDPWRWVLEGTLVMSTGGGLPSEPDVQAIWLKKIANTKASALVLAPSKLAPRASRAMRDMADKLDFPLLEASFELEFMYLARLVIESVLQAQRNRFDVGQRLFRTYASVLSEATELDERLNILGKRLGANLQIIDNNTNNVLLDCGTVKLENAGHRSVPIPSSANTRLAVSSTDLQVFEDPFLSRILAGLLAVDLERLFIDLDKKRIEGESLFNDLLSGDINFASARTMLIRRGLGERLVSLAIDTKTDDKSGLDNIHRISEFYKIAPLLGCDNGIFIAIVPNSTNIHQAILNHLGPNTKIGVSNTLNASIDFYESIRQARLALSKIHESNDNIGYYGKLDFQVTMGPKTVSEAKEIVRGYLGPIQQYEHANGSIPLLKTLYVFITNNCSWKLSASILDIHRQTLVYRLKLIEDLTGLKPTESAGIAKFWLAFEAYKIIGFDIEADI